MEQTTTQQLGSRPHMHRGRGQIPNMAVKAVTQRECVGLNPDISRIYLSVASVEGLTPTWRMHGRVLKIDDNTAGAEATSDAKCYPSNTSSIVTATLKLQYRPTAPGRH